MREGRSPADGGATGRLLLSAGPLFGRGANAEERRRRSAGALLSGARPISPSGNTTKRSPATRRRPRPATTPTIARWARPKRNACPATPARPWPRSTRCPAPSSRRPNICIQRGATVSALGGNPQRSRGAVRAGRRGRSQSCRRPVRPGHGKRSPRQRRHGARSVRAVGGAVSDPRRLAVEPGRAVRRSPAVRPGSAVLPADPGRLSRITPGRGCS